MTTEGPATGRDLWQRARAFALRGRERGLEAARAAAEAPASRAARRYEDGRGELAAGRVGPAIAHFRQALRLGGAFTWPHGCKVCRTETPTWQERCSRCGAWNTVRPVDGR